MKDYEKIKELSPEAYDFLTQKLLGKNMPVGVYPLESGGQVQVQEYKTKFRKDASFESHKKFIDVQVVLEGKEIISTSALGDLEVEIPYNPDRDIIFYKKTVNGVDHYLEAGDFLIFRPEDGHLPSLCVDEPSTVRKVVIKIPVA